MKRFWLVVLSIFILIFCSPPLWACPFELPTVRVTVNSHELIIELATTPETRSCGLSLRSKLPANRGMLFAYNEPEILTFWMKNTHIPLSIAFIDYAGGIVDIQKMNPLLVNINYISPIPVSFALEVNQGWFEDNDIGIGDKLIFDFPATLEIR